MADWSKRTSARRYRYMRVDRKTGREVARLDMLRGGRITRNLDVRVMETAEVTTVGSLSIGPDLVRIYMDAEWPDGERESVALGTFIPTIPSRDVSARFSRSKVTMRGRLQELLDDGFSSPIVLPGGTNAVDAARKICEEMGIAVIADPSDFAITRERVYGIGAEQNNSEVGDTKLDMVNDLLSLAGFWAAKTDPYGRVLLRKHRAVSERPPVWSFIEGSSAIFEPQMEEERDTASVANHVVCYYSSDSETMVGEAWDRDPESEFSTVSVGRTITKSYSYTDLPDGKTQQDRQTHADNAAKRLLGTAQSVIHRVRLRHAYAPMTVTEAVDVSYPSGRIAGRYEIRVQEMELSGGTPTNTELRSWERWS